MKRPYVLLLLAVMMLTSGLMAQAKKSDKDTTDYLSSRTFSGLKMRLLGPAVTSGRIIDIAVHPTDHNTWFVAVACGGVWKTSNAGVTFQPVFDKQGSFSIGCVTFDPSNPNTVWVGSGENNSQRSVSYGDGIYRSMDGGKNWKNMGLKKSEHIGKIVVDPKNSQIVYVAAQGPLWGPGGDRGLYKTTDGGESWEAVLKISENTGVSDIVMDPRDHNVLYASSYQRRRHVWTLINGGPEGALYKSTDAGKNWFKLTEGLPSGDVGRIGLAISPVNPDVVFALIEASEGGGFFRSMDRGATWEKRYEYKSTSAQYYQEIFCDPKNVDRLYSMDTYLQVTEDGGKTWTRMSNNHRHVDDHAIWIDPDNTNHLLIGGDGGLYETFDRGANFRFFQNLPITQFYRVTTDNSEPFYYVYGGTQDNNTWGGPSRTISTGGITNEDWFLVVGGDGYQAQVDPTDPNIVYGEYQYGGLVRMDRKSGEVLFIQPQPEKGEEHRWNWDTPIVISAHKHTRVYAAANKLFRTDDRGHTWTTISPDLTRQIERNKLPVFGKIMHADAVAKNASTSFFGNIVALTESPKNENMLVVGTDDGLIQVTEDGGKNWRRLDKFPGVPDTTYVSDVFASLHNENVIYASFDNHKNNDFKPYLLKSTDKGKSWTSIRGNLPDNGAVYTINEDHVNPNLLFAGTEFGAYFTIDGGKKWIQLKGDMPIIAVRDINIQRRENDVVLGTFGRGFYVLDNYAPLRELNPDMLYNESALFSVKDALMYMPDYSREKYDQGEMFWRAKNPDFGATFTYYLKQDIKTKRDLRKEAEAEAEKNKKTAPYPSMEELRAEDEELAPYLIFTVTDEAGTVIRKLNAPAKAGMNRITWDLRYPDASPITEKTETNKNAGMPVLPGLYKVTMAKSVNGVITQLAGPVPFTVKPLNNTTLPAKDRKALVEFQRKVARLQQAVTGATSLMDEASSRMKLIEKAVFSTPGASYAMIEKIRTIKQELADIQRTVNGDKTKDKRNENQPPSVNDRLLYILYGVFEVTSDPTATQLDAYRLASADFAPALARLKTVIETDIKGLEADLEKLDAPWTPGRLPDWKPE